MVSSDELLNCVFAICILGLCGTPEAVFESIAKHYQIRWIAEQAREAAEK
jgi:hypothetical protein